ncbi:MAG: hypothetical protein N3A02_02550 [Rectinema sp.]|nr:hypothetical protein [Rectinema sp.]
MLHMLCHCLSNIRLIHIVEDLYQTIIGFPGTQYAIAYDGDHVLVPLRVRSDVRQQQAITDVRDYIQQGLCEPYLVMKSDDTILAAGTWQQSLRMDALAVVLPERDPQRRAWIAQTMHEIGFAPLIDEVVLRRWYDEAGLDRPHPTRMLPEDMWHVAFDVYGMLPYHRVAIRSQGPIFSDVIQAASLPETRHILEDLIGSCQRQHLTPLPHIWQSRVSILDCADVPAIVVAMLLSMMTSRLVLRSETSPCMLFVAPSVIADEIIAQSVAAIARGGRKVGVSLVLLDAQLDGHPQLRDLLPAQANGNPQDHSVYIKDGKSSDHILLPDCNALAESHGVSLQQGILSFQHSSSSSRS